MHKNADQKSENKFSAPCFVTFAAKATAAISPSETSHKSTKKGNFRYAKVMVISLKINFQPRAL